MRETRFFVPFDSILSTSSTPPNKHGDIPYSLTTTLLGTRMLRRYLPQCCTVSATLSLFRRSFE